MTPTADDPVRGLLSRAFVLALEAVVALAAAVSALGVSGLVEGFRPLAGLQFVLVFCVVLAGLRTYRWVVDRRFREDSRRMLAEAETAVADTKDQFLANVSHGLRTPLTGIVGFAHVLKGSLRQGEDRAAVEMIMGESAELSRIIDDLLMATRLDAGVLEISLQDVPVDEQIGQVVDYMELLEARVHVDCQQATVNVDPERFRQVLRNLLVNAHRHGRPAVAVKGHVHQGRYICHVIDHGPGVPGDLQGRLFDRFAYRSDGTVHGHVGLGLSIVQQLSSMMGIEVSYRRIRGETHFVMSIPLGEAGQEPAGADGGRLLRTPERLVRVGDRLVSLPA